MTTPRPWGLLAELTHRCPLHCPYCSNPLRLVPRGDELSVADWLRVIDEAAALGIVQIGFSGGEPLLYPALDDLIFRARQADLYTNLITSGVGLTPERALRLKAAGLDAVQISFQADEEERGDAIAGAKAHAAKLAAVAAVREADLPWGANVVLHRRNVERLEAVICLTERLGAIRIELAHVQFYGWAFPNRERLLPTRSQVERAAEIAEREEVRLRGRMQVVHVRPDWYDRRPKPCLHGWGSRGLTVNPRGDVLPCQAAEAIPGLAFDNVREKSLAAIWSGSEAFNRFRGTEWMPEPCRSCDLREFDFGGCRCQAALLAGDPRSADPVCDLSPARPIIDRLLEQAEADLAGDWTMRG